MTIKSIRILFLTVIPDWCHGQYTASVSCGFLHKGDTHLINFPKSAGVNESNTLDRLPNWWRVEEATKPRRWIMRNVKQVRFHDRVRHDFVESCLRPGYTRQVWWVAKLWALCVWRKTLPESVYNLGFAHMHNQSYHIPTLSHHLM